MLMLLFALLVFVVYFFVGRGAVVERDVVTV